MAWLSRRDGASRRRDAGAELRIDGIGLFFACTAAEASIEETVRPMLYCVAILLIGLLLVAFIPEVSLFLPRLFGISGQ